MVVALHGLSLRLKQHYKCIDLGLDRLKVLVHNTINDYNSIIEEFQKSYEQTPVTQRYARARILSGMKKAKRELAKTLIEYDKFKKYKTRTAISK
jgi:hypothetical protein